MSREVIDTEIFRFIYAQAMNDATNRVCNKGTKDKLMKNIGLRNCVKNHAEEVINGEGKMYSID